MQQLNLVIAVCAATVFVLGILSDGIKRAPLSIPLIALTVGVLAGPEVLGWMDVTDWPDRHAILKEAARLTLAISVTGIALRTPREDYRLLGRPVLLLLTLGMLLMWAVSGALAWAALGLTPLVAAVIGAAVTPTDPVVASSIVSGKVAERKLPDRVRSTLSLESGANDGLGYLILMLPLMLITHGVGGDTLGAWLREVVLLGIVGAVAVGLVLGIAAGIAVRWTDSTGMVEKTSMLGLSLALSLGALAGAKLMGADGILAAFAAGAGFNFTLRNQERLEEENVQEAILKLFDLPVFILLGAMLPWADWAALGWTGVALAAAVLLLRRPVMMAIIGPVMGGGLLQRDVVFLGWFAPVGVAAIYYSLHAMEQTGDHVIWAAGSLIVVASVVVHGVTSAPGMALHVRAEDRG